MNPTGHVDFYPGTEDEASYGRDQPGCSAVDNICDHSRAFELFNASITNNQSCYAMKKCTGVDDSDTYLVGCEDLITAMPQMGYWYDGNSPGLYGLTTTGEKPFCEPCPEDIDCTAGGEVRTKISDVGKL